MDTPDNNDIKEDAPAAVPSGPGVGQLLRAARLEQGISIQDVARQLRFSARQVTALEEDEYGQLAGGTFLRGFVRNYAKLLQLDEAPLLRVLEQSVPPSPSQIVPPPIEGIPFPSNQGQRKRNLVIAGVVIALLLLVYEIYRSNESSVEKQPTVEAEAKAGVASAGNAGTDARGTVQQPPLSDGGSADTAVPASAVPEGAGGVNANEAVMAEGSPDAHMQGIRLTFEGESWTEVKDGKDQVLLSQVNPPGTEQVLRGVPPYFLVIGNAVDVKLVYNSTPIDLAPYTNLYGGTARLTLE